MTQMSWPSRIRHVYGCTPLSVADSRRFHESEVTVGARGEIPKRRGLLPHPCVAPFAVRDGPTRPALRRIGNVRTLLGRGFRLVQTPENLRSQTDGIRRAAQQPGNLAPWMLLP